MGSAATTAKKGVQIDSSLHEFYYGDEREIWILHDLRDEEAVRQAHELRAVWRGRSDILAVDNDHVVIAIRPGGAARRLAA